MHMQLKNLGPDLFAMMLHSSGYASEACVPNGLVCIEGSALMGILAIP